MSGAGSRARRTEAVAAARDAVYRRDGAPYADECNPFADERRQRIFRGAYLAWASMYRRNESLVRELAEVYGGVL